MGEGRAEYDAARTKALNRLGIRVVSVRNEEVGDIFTVLRRIAAAAGVDYDAPREKRW